MARDSRAIPPPPPEHAGVPRGGNVVEHPQFPHGRARMTISGLPPGDDEATAITIAHMAHYAKQDSLSPIVRRAAAEAAATAQGNSAADIAEAVFRWIQRRIRFQVDQATARPVSQDAENTEVLIRPVDLLTMPRPAGDCDDFSMLCASMLRALGIETSFKTVAADPAAPHLYSHVYVIAHTSEGAIALDTSHGDRPGWEVRTAGKSRIWRVEDAMPQLGALPEWATELIKIGGQTGAKIAEARFGQPPEGTYIQRGDEIFFRQPQGSAPFAFPGVGVNVGGGGSGTLLLVVGVVALLLVMNRR